MKIRLFPISATMLSYLLIPTLVFAQGLNNTLTPFAGTAGGSNLINTIGTIVNWFLGLASIVAGIMIVYGGVQYILAGLDGGSGDASGAKQTIIYAVIGLIVIGLSAVIVNFTLGAF